MQVAPASSEIDAAVSSVSGESTASTAEESAITAYVELHNPALQRRLGEEYERCQVYLDATTRGPLISVVESRLLEAHLAALLEKGFASLMDGARLTDLARLYRQGCIH